MHSERLEIALSPCPNDVFLVAGLILKKVPHSLDLTFHFVDIETLNEFLLEKKFPVIKGSFAVYSEILRDYEILGVGSALGFGVGPILVAKESHRGGDFSGLKIALPGRHTTAHFLWNYFYGDAKVEKLFLPFNEIIPALLEGKADLGILIHEGRFVYQKYQLTLVSDLGALWERETKAPLPLGGFFIKRELPRPLKNEILKLFRQSLNYALSHREEVYPLLKEYAQELDKEVIFKHIDTYVNPFTYRLEGEGLRGLEIFLKALGLKEALSNYLWEEENGIA